MDNRMTPGTLPDHPSSPTAARTIQDIVAMAAELPGRWAEAFERNISLAFPPLRPDPDWCNFPLVARVVDRGWPLLGVSDWGAMEMYGTRVVAMDPFTVASQVFG